MHSLLSPEFYLSDAIFQREQQRIFRTMWIFAGLANVLAKQDSFLTRNIGGLPILVQNCGGTIKAFINQCAHRQAPIQQADYGLRRLACPYHGWVYDNGGKVRSIPGCEHLYGFTQNEVSGLRLTEIAVERVGSFVFVCLDSNPVPIGQQLHDAYRQRLASISGQIDSELIDARFKADFNWKLNYENVNDTNHVPFVHPKSFAPLLGAQSQNTWFESQSAAPSEASANLDVRDLSYELKGTITLPHWPWHEWIEPFEAPDSYNNYFVYPNLNVMSIGGRVLSLQQFNPVAPGRTEVSLTVALGRRLRRIPAYAAIVWSHLRSEKKVIDEDVALLEGLQNNLHMGGRRAFQGRYEEKLKAIARVYLAQLDMAESA